MSQSLSRDFKGIWIPKEIWLAEGLSANEKILWAEIHSLYNAEKGGCYASNEYLANFMASAERTVRDALYKLRQLKLIEDVSFDGRQRIIKAVEPDKEFDRRLAEWRKSASVKGGENPPPSEAENRHPSLIIERKDEGIDNPPYPPYPNTAASPHAAKAADENLDLSTKSKKGKTLTEFTLEVQELTKNIVQALHVSNPHWLVPKNLHHLMTQVHEMISKENRSSSDIFDVFMWAINDHFWSAKLAKPNPIKYLREKFSQLAGAMNAKPSPRSRKFAPSSNDQAALEIMKEMSKGAI